MKLYSSPTVDEQLDTFTGITLLMKILTDKSIRVCDFYGEDVELNVSTAVGFIPLLNYTQDAQRIFEKGLGPKYFVFGDPDDFDQRELAVFQNDRQDMMFTEFDTLTNPSEDYTVVGTVQQSSGQSTWTFSQI